VPGNDLVEVPFFVELEGDSLLAEQTGPTLNLGIFAYAISSDGVLVAHLGQGLSLDLRIYGDQLLASGLKFAGRLTMPPGLHSLRLLARNQDSDRVFLTISQVEVPGVDHEGKTLLPPVFDEPNDTWVLTRQSDLELDSIGLRLGEDRVLPATRVVVESRVPTELVLGGAGWDTTTRVTARVLDRQGRHVATPIITIGQGVGLSEGPVSLFQATLGAFDLPLGWYTLELILDDEASGSRLSRQIPVAVLTYGTPEVWASLDKPSGAASTARPSTEATAIELAEEEIVAGYLSALRSLAQGDRYEARDALTKLERTLVNGGSRWAVATLERTERRVARKLAQSDPGVIVPILLLHRDTFRQYLAVRDDQLANHTWRLVATLAEDAPRSLRSGQWAGFSETLLVALAADLVRASLVSSAIELLERTVELAPTNPEALLALGATLERSGKYDEALSPLRRLVRDNPDAAEGALRLAVNLARTGDPDDAKEVFRNLINGRSSGWIQILSYQELASLVVASTAEQLLREGVDRFPSNQAMRIQLACLLDHRGRAVEAGSLIDRLTSRAAAPDTSPRVRYLAWPSLGLVEELSDYELRAERESSGLVAALDERASEQERS
jgi:tetratricopeptide (TPR) repeat protein